MITRKHQDSLKEKREHSVMEMGKEDRGIGAGHCLSPTTLLVFTFLRAFLRQLLKFLCTRPPTHSAYFLNVYMHIFHPRNKTGLPPPLGVPLCQ